MKKIVVILVLFSFALGLSAYDNGGSVGIGDQKSESTEVDSAYASEVSVLFDQYNVDFDGVFNSWRRTLSRGELYFETTLGTEELMMYKVETYNTQVWYYQGLSHVAITNNEDTIELAELFNSRADLIMELVNKISTYDDPTEIMLEIRELDVQANEIIERLLDDGIISEETAKELSYIKF